MTAVAQIHPDKVRAYLATDYRVGHTSQDINKDAIVWVGPDLVAQIILLR